MESAMQIDVDALQKKYAEEREKRLRHLSYDPYPELKGKFESFDQDPFADPDFEREPVTDEVDVLIIGGGVAGLMAGVRLRQQGVRSLRVIEKAETSAGPGTGTAILARPATSNPTSISRFWRKRDTCQANATPVRAKSRPICKDWRSATNCTTAPYSRPSSTNFAGMTIASAGS